MLESKFKAHYQHVWFSEKTKSDIDEIGKDVLQKIKHMDSNHLIAIISNETVKSMFNLICDLQEIVIKSNAEELSNSTLKRIVKILNQDCNDLVQEYENRKEKFVMFIQNILHETEQLFMAIKMPDLSSHKHELVLVLKEILCTLHRIQIRIRIQNLNVQQLIQIIADTKKQYYDDISHIGNYANSENLKYIATHRWHANTHCFELASYLNKIASNYDGEIQNKIWNAANLFSNATAGWMFNSTKFEIETDLVDLCDASDKLWAPIEDLLRYIEKELEGSTNLKDAVAHVISYGVVGNSNTGRSMKHEST